MAIPLSVIIPTYNRAHSIAAAVRSALDGGPQGMQAVVVDDGSTDATPDVLRSFNSTVLTIRQENAGPSAARNRGIAASTGRYLAFLDSDDLWLPGAAPRMVEFLDATPEVDVVFADTLAGNDADGFFSLTNRLIPEGFDSLDAVTTEDGWRVLPRRPFFQRLARRNLFCMGSAIVRRSAIEHAGGFDPSLGHGEDWDLFLRVASRSRFASFPEPLTRYFMHEGERQSSDAERMLRGYGAALTNVLPRCDAQDRALVRRQLEHQLFGYAYLAYDRGDYREAARRFDALVRSCRWSVRGFLFRALCLLPDATIDRVRACKQRLVPA